MAKKISQLAQLLRTAIASGDKIPILDESAGQTKYVTVGDLVGIPEIGWTAAGEAWAYNAWDNTLKRGTITVPTDATTKYSPGMYIKFSQSTGGVKYGRILSVTSTTIVFYSGSQTLNNEAITLPFYSGEAQPIGLPSNIRSFNPYKFQAYVLSAGVSVANNGIIPYNTEVFDTNANFDTSTYKYTVPVDGFYYLGATCYVVGEASQPWIGLYKNGSKMSDGMILPNAGSVNCATNIQGVYKLAAGDTIEVRRFNSSANSRNVYGTLAGLETMFCGYLVSEGAV